MGIHIFRLSKMLFGFTQFKINVANTKNEYSSLHGCRWSNEVNEHFVLSLFEWPYSTMFSQYQDADVLYERGFLFLSQLKISTLKPNISSTSIGHG